MSTFKWFWGIMLVSVALALLVGRWVPVQPAPTHTPHPRASADAIPTSAPARLPHHMEPHP